MKEIIFLYKFYVFFRKYCYFINQNLSKNTKAQILSDSKSMKVKLTSNLKGFLSLIKYKSFIFYTSSICPEIGCPPARLGLLWQTLPWRRRDYHLVRRIDEASSKPDPEPGRFQSKRWPKNDRFPRIDCIQCGMDLDGRSSYV